MKAIVSLFLFVAMFSPEARGGEPSASSVARIVHQGLEPHEVLEFETRIIPRIQEFLTFWQKNGLYNRRLQNEIRIYAQPSPWLSKSMALSTLYGPDFERELSQFIKKLRESQSVQGIERDLAAFTCRYPPLFSGVAWRRAGGPIEALKREAEDEYQRIVDSSRLIPGFLPDHGVYLQGPGQCSALLFGRSSNPKVRPHSYLAEDVVLHELGHGLIEGGVAEDRFLPRAFQETVADVLAHAFMDENCHGIHLDPATGTVNCRRDMNRGGESLADALWRDRPHLAGDAVRKLFWSAYVEAGLEAFVRAFGRALVAIPKMRFIPRLRDLPNDPFRRARLELQLDHALHSALVSNFCARIGRSARQACQGRKQALGTLDRKALEQMIRNSPSQVGVSGKVVAVGDRRFRASFVFRPGMLSLKLAPFGWQGQDLQYSCVKGGMSTVERLVLLRCTNLVSGGVVHWTSSGVFRGVAY